MLRKTYNHVHNILRRFDGWANFLLSQVKHSVIISKKLVNMSFATSCQARKQGSEEIKKYKENLKTS